MVMIRVCPACRKEYAAKARGWGPDRPGCRDRAACVRRSLDDAVTRPYVGDFDPAAAYADAPKLGETQ